MRLNTNSNVRLVAHVRSLTSCEESRCRDRAKTNAPVPTLQGFDGASIA